MIVVAKALTMNPSTETTSTKVSAVSLLNPAMSIALVVNDEHEIESPLTTLYTLASNPGASFPDTSWTTILQ